MSNSFNENTRVKIPATIHLLRLGYKYQSYNDAIKSGFVDNRTKIFKNLFKPSIEKINGRLFTNDEINSLLEDILGSIKNNDLGKDFYNWLINPIDRVKLIDFENINNNSFYVVNELIFGDKIKGSFRPDINILVNGIPLAFLEVKNPNNDGGIQVEFNRMVNERYEEPENRRFFNMIQMTCSSNNMEYESDDDRGEDPKAGSFYSTPNGKKTTFNFFRDEKKKKDGFIQDDPNIISFILQDNKYDPNIKESEEFKTNLSINSPCNVFCSSIFERERFLFFIHYGILYVEKAVREKHIMRYPQFFAARALIDRLKLGKKNGIIWHTQGSGKTALSIYCNRILNDYFAKEGIQTRFFYVVDRLDLLEQTKIEYSLRNCEAIGVDDKQSFIKELSKPLSVGKSHNASGSCTIVNIQKFVDSLPTPNNDYNAKVQRIFFIDEAHRSYSKGTGEFYKNLMLIDRDAIFIALTGTPLLGKKERSNLRFGEYIHKYFYDKSILDGYTLKIKKEEMETVAKAEIKRNLELELKSGDTAKILESDEYICALGKYIDADFTNFRFINADMSIGGMIVCNSNPQAIKMQKWFENNSRLNTRLVISDESIPSEVNKENQLAFKDPANKIDIMIVHLMLTTGYDVDRLKKMYLLRAPKEHSLLQTISRVNRPYKSPNGTIYRYGYISDFVDITEEYDRTVANYLEELKFETTDEEGEGSSPNALLVSPDDIQKKYEKAVIDLRNICDTSNKEEFNIFLNRIADKRQLFTLRSILNKIKDCKTEFLLSRADEQAKQIDKDEIRQLLKLVQNRIDFLNITDRPIDAMRILSQKEVVEIVFSFIKVRTTILDMTLHGGGIKTKERFAHLSNTIQNIKNQDDERVIRLNDFIREILKKLQICDLSNLDAINDEILVAINEAEAINRENEELASRFDGQFAYVKTYQDIVKEMPEVNKDNLLQLLKIIQENVTSISSVNNLILLGRTNFIDNVKKKVTPILLKQGIYNELKLKDWYDSLLVKIYINLQLYC